MTINNKPAKTSCW